MWHLITQDSDFFLSGEGIQYAADQAEKRAKGDCTMSFVGISLCVFTCYHITHTYTTNAAKWLFLENCNTSTVMEAIGNREVGENTNDALFSGNIHLYLLLYYSHLPG